MRFEMQVWTDRRSIRGPFYGLPQNKFNRHKMSLQCLRTACQMAGMATTKEVHADFAIYELGVSGRTYTDVRVVRPSAKTYIKEASKKAGHAAELEEKANFSKYSSKIESSTQFVPHVLETYGRLGKELLKFLDRIFISFKRRNQPKQDESSQNSSFKSCYVPCKKETQSRSNKVGHEAGAC
jgi:hypothetical protein